MALSGHGQLLWRLASPSRLSIRPWLLACCSVLLLLILLIASTSAQTGTNWTMCLSIPGYSSPLEGYDIPGQNVFPTPVSGSYLDMAEECSKVPTCVAFNTDGWLKSMEKMADESTLVQNAFLQPCQGLYLKVYDTKAVGPICEGDPDPILSCSNGLVNMEISRITSAFYGRSDGVTCLYSNPSTMQNTTCSSAEFNATVSQLCIGTLSCTIKFADLEDPCVGTHKWASITYTCSLPGANCTPSSFANDGLCGLANGGKCCNSGSCCSQYGTCGASDAFCGAGCQSSYSYNCKRGMIALPPPAPPPPSPSSPSPPSPSPSPPPPPPSPSPPSPPPRPPLVHPNTDAIIGYTVAGVTAAAVVCAIVVYAIVRYCRKKRDSAAVLRSLDVEDVHAGGTMPAAAAGFHDNSSGRGVDSGGSRGSGGENPTQAAAALTTLGCAPPLTAASRHVVAAAGQPAAEESATGRQQQQTVQGVSLLQAPPPSPAPQAASASASAAVSSSVEQERLARNVAAMAEVSAANTASTTAVQPPTAARGTPAEEVEGDRPPAMFLCPILQDVMEDPVVAADGFTYEREAITAWITRNGGGREASPMTNLPLQSTGLVPNIVVRTAIREWKEQQRQ